MHAYRKLLEEILENGTSKSDRTGVGTLSLFGYSYKFDLHEGFPLLTGKRMPWKAVVCDILWMLSGSTNISYLNQNGVHIWDPWADESGEVGPVYGKQWRFWPDGNGGSIDQVSTVIEEIKKNPDSRRLIVNAWNVADLTRMAVPPCPVLFQFNVTQGALSCHLYQRSADAFIGLPFNIAGFSLLTHMVASVCGLKVGTFMHSFGDLHLYSNHIKQAEEFLDRAPLKLPELKLNQSISSIFDFKLADIKIKGYKSHPAISAPVAV